MELNQNMVPKWFAMTVAGLVVLFLGLVVADKIYSFTQHFTKQKPNNTISMSAEGRVTAVPDLATVSLGVVTEGVNAADVQNESTNKLNKITDFIKNQGIAKEDIATSQFSIYPKYDYLNGRSVLNGYTANQTLTVQVHDVDKSADKVNKILAGASANGANQVLGVNFSFDDPDNLLQQARKLAIAKAKQKAKELASEVGLKLGKVVSISEASNGYPGPIPYAQSDLAAKGGGPVQPDVQTGSQDIVADMTLVFEVK